MVVRIIAPSPQGEGSFVRTLWVNPILCAGLRDVEGAVPYDVSEILNKQTGFPFILYARLRTVGDAGPYR